MEKAFYDCCKFRNKVCTQPYQGSVRRWLMPSITFFRIGRLKQAYFPNQSTLCSAEYCYYRVTHKQRNDVMDSRSNKTPEKDFLVRVGVLWRESELHGL